MIASFEKYKLHLEMLPFFYEYDFSKIPAEAQNQNILLEIDRNTSKAIETANLAVIEQGRKLVAFVRKKAQTLSRIERPALPAEPAFIADHVRTLKKLILNPKVPAAELKDPKGKFQTTLAELRNFSYANHYVIPADTTQKQADEFQSFFDGFRNLFAEYCRLIEIRNLTADTGDYLLGFYEEKFRKDVLRAKEYWKAKKVRWVNDLQECEKEYFASLKSLPLAITQEEEERIFSFIGNRNSVYYNDGNKEEHKAVKDELQKLFAKRAGDVMEFPIACMDAVYTPKGAPQQKFHFPVTVSRRDCIYLLADAEQQKATVRCLFDTMISQFLRGTNAGEMEIDIVDAVYSGDFVPKFQKNIAPERKGDKPAAVVNLLATHDANELKDFLKKYVEKHVRQTIQVLGDQYRFAEDFNRDNPSLPIARKMLLLNGMDRFFRTGSMNTVSDLQNLVDIVKDAAKCGIFIVLCGSGECLELLKKNAGPAGEHIRAISIPQDKTNELILPDADGGIEFRHPGFKIASAFNLLQTTQAEVEKLCIGLREIQGSVDLSVNLSGIIESTGGIFSCAAYNKLRVPFGKNARGEVTYWYCDKEIAGHTLIVGGTGSGKSNLLHCLITSACYLHRPDEFQIYLVDLKKGVEFKRYADSGLPHARVVAIEGDAEMALGVLESVYKLYEKHSELMKRYDAENLETLWANGGKAPRIALVIDEFQLLFENDNTKQDASRYLEKLIKEGRAAGFNVILATQNPANVPSGIKDNVTTRIVMKNKREIFTETAGFQNKDYCDRINRPGDFLLLESGEPVLGRTALIKRDYQEELMKNISEASSGIRLNYETLIYDGTAFPSGENRIFRRMLEKSAEQQYPTFVLGEDKSLSRCVYCSLEDIAGENILIAGNHGRLNDLNREMEWDDEENGEEDVAPAIACSSAVYWTLSRSLNSLLANGGFHLSVFDRQNYLLPYLEPSADCTTLRNAREVADEIYKLYDLAKDCEKRGVTAPERRMLAILNAQSLLQLQEMTRPGGSASATPAAASSTLRAAAPAAPSQAPRSSAMALLSSIKPARLNDAAGSSAASALRYLLQNGPQFNIHILMGTNNAGILLREVLERGSNLKNLFHHMICMQMSEEDLSVNLGVRTIRLTDMGPRYAFYANELISARPQRFRPYRADQEGE